MSQTSPKVVLVTGATGGIGSAICKRFAEAGYQVVVTYRSSQEAADDLLRSFEGLGHSALRVEVDNSSSIERIAKAVHSHYGKLDVLVNNAGFSKFVAHDDLEGLDDDFFDQIFQVNVRGAFAMIRGFKDMLLASGEASVINISSIAGRTGNGSNVAYCASKAAMDSMTRSLARALSPDIRVLSIAPGYIRVLSIAPGLVEGPYTEKLDPEWNQAQRDATPLKRLAQASDVAEAVYVAAAHLKFSTGDIIPVDGGRPLT